MTQTEEPARPREPLEATIRKATSADVAPLTAVMARAFDDDPFANWVVLQDKRRARRIYDFMEVAVRRMSLPHGDVYTTPEFQGGALWTPPGKWKMSFLQQLLMTPTMLRCTGWRRVPAVVAELNMIEKKHPHVPHYYLLGLGVEPELQGRGIGTQLMRPVLERCDRDGVGAYLESSKEKNVPLYERNGFRVTEVVQIKDGPPLWLMWRDPQSSGPTAAGS